MGNEADRLLRARKRAVEDAAAADKARTEWDIREAQRRLMSEIEEEIPRALTRLAAKSYIDGELAGVPVRRGVGPFKSSKVRYVEKASWSVHFVLLPGKESPDRQRFVLISDGYMLGPYGIPLSQQRIDEDWRGYKKYPRIVGINPWPGFYAPGMLTTVLARLRGLPFMRCRYCQHPIVRQPDGTWGHHQFEYPSSCRVAKHERLRIWDDDLDGRCSAEPSSE